VSDDATSRLAYDEAVRALRTQADAFNGVRQRAGTVLATALVVTAFFGGQAVARGSTPTATGWFAVVAFLIAGGLSLAVLFPSDPMFSSDADTIVALVEDAAPGTEPVRDLALALASRHRANSRSIGVLQWVFRAAAAVLLAEVFLWILFLAES